MPAQGQIAHTGTTCNDFRTGVAGDLTEVLYGVKNGKINNAAPGVFFYYTHVTAPASSFTIDIVETNNNGSFNLFGVHGGQVNVFDGTTCGGAGVSTTTTITTGNVRIAVSGATVGQTFIVSVKYDTSAPVGQSVSNPPPTVHYNFATKVNNVVVETDPDGLDLKPKP